jgi:spermidine/putrescine transport system substrate-binding protein
VERSWRRGGISAESAQNAGASDAASAGPSAAPAQGGDVLNFSNWPLYMDTGEDDEQSHPTLDAFAEQTGIEVDYFEDINSNEEYFGKIRNQLAAGGRSAGTSWC